MKYHIVNVKTIQMMDATLVNAFAKALQVHTSDNLSYFDRIPLEWYTFAKGFRESTKTCKFSKAEIVIRLRTCLKRETKDALSGLLSISENIEDNMDRLRRRYLVDLMQSSRKWNTISEG